VRSELKKALRMYLHLIILEFHVLDEWPMFALTVVIICKTSLLHFCVLHKVHPVVLYGILKLKLHTVVEITGGTSERTSVPWTAR
jgi:hypothetical protein